MAERIVSASILGSIVWIVCASTMVMADMEQSKQSSSDLEGTWFVLIHYRDSATKNASSDRWLDKVWTFESKGSRLYWVEYPIVVLEDSDGRFESYKGNPRSRVLEKWKPNKGQLAEIMDGPRVNTRGSKSKSLRGSDAKGWRSTGRNRVSGANVLGFHEEWSIDREGDERKLMITEVLGNAVQGNAEGKTTYVIKSGDSDGLSYVGGYDRDGARVGTFEMFRTPAIRPLLSSEKEGTVNERLRKRSYEGLIRISE